MRLAPDSLAYSFALAADVMAGVLGGCNLDVALAALPAGTKNRPAVMDLTYTALRRFGRGDALLAPLLKSPIKDSAIRGLLLCAIARLELRPEEAHTTVDQAVAAANELSEGRMRAFVNAILRNFLRQKEQLTAQAEASAEGRWQHPQWWIDSVKRTYPHDWQTILAAGNSHPPMTLRVNLRKTTRADYLQQLTGEAIAAEILDCPSNAAIRLLRPVSVDRLPGFFDGLVSVQDKGAQIAASLLDLQPGQRVLDACAAPGGKTAHMLETCDVDLLALELSAERAERIHQNLDRLGLQAEVKIADAQTISGPHSWWDGRPFERILADVPCSASGVVARHPDAKWLRRGTDPTRFVKMQQPILDTLWQTLAPGGKLLYCTCSIFPRENTEQAEAFAHRHPDAIALPLTDHGSFLQLLPDESQDGFFYALFQKNAASE